MHIHILILFYLVINKFVMPQVQLEIDFVGLQDDAKIKNTIEDYALVFLRMDVAVKSVSALVNAYLKGVSLEQEVIRENNNITNTESKKEKRKRLQKATNRAMKCAQAKEKKKEES